MTELLHSHFTLEHAKGLLKQTNKLTKNPNILLPFLSSTHVQLYTVCEKTGEVWKQCSCEEPVCHLVTILSLHAEKVNICLKPNVSGS